MRKSLQAAAAASTAVFAILGPTLPANAAVDGTTVQVIVDGVAHNVAVGDVVAQGTSVTSPDGVEQHCQIPPIEIATQTPTAAPGSAAVPDVTNVVLEVESACTVAVSAIESGQETNLLDPSGEISTGAAANTAVPSADVLPVGVTGECALQPLGITSCGPAYTGYVGETKATVLEQFGITAYETDTKLYYSQSNRDGSTYGYSTHWYCYHSGFPGNHFRGCTGWSPHWSGTYSESDATAYYWNSYLPVSMNVNAQYTATQTNWGGRCSISNGSLPPTWQLQCSITRVQQHQ